MQKTLIDPVAAAGAHGDLLSHWLRLDRCFWLMHTVRLLAGLASRSACRMAAEC